MAKVCIVDLLDPEERLQELGRLISLLPVANYTLLRALSAHILQVVQNASVNKMSILNIGIVFALTLGIPGSILNMVLTEYDYVFWTNDEAQVTVEEADTKTKSLEDEEMPKSEAAWKPSLNTLTVLQGDGHRNNRNSMIFSSGAPNAIKHIEKNLESKSQIMCAIHRFSKKIQPHPYLYSQPRNQCCFQMTRTPPTLYIRAIMKFELF